MLNSDRIKESVVNVVNEDQIPASATVAPIQPTMDEAVIDEYFAEDDQAQMDALQLAAQDP